MAVGLAACGSGGGNDADDRPTVVASFYPLAYAASEIGGGNVRVRNLAPPGVEPHDLELSPKDADAIEAADVVLVLGRDFQPAVERVAQRNRHTVALLDRLDIGGDDPHVWLDPLIMSRIVTEIGRALSMDGPAGALSAEIQALDGRFRAGLAECKRKKIVTAHESFGRLASRYGLTQHAVAGLSPEAEPDPATLAELADLIRREGITTVFTEELVSPQLARTLAREAGVGTEVLNPLEGLSTAEQRAGATYITVMDANLQKLRRALGCT